MRVNHMRMIARKLLQMAKSMCLPVFMIAFSLLWPCFSTINTENELADKDQQIIELLKERVDSQKKTSELQDTIKLLSKKISNLELNSECAVELYEYALQIKDHERKVGKLEDEIKLLQGQIIAKTKEISSHLQLLEDCNAAHNYISFSFFPFIIGMIVGMTALFCCCGLIANADNKIRQLQLTN